MEASRDPLRAKLDALLGCEGPVVHGRDPVNLPMIRHWCDAVDDRNPIYTDPAFARASRHGGIVAPPTMLQAWTMPGLRRADPGAETPHPLSQVLSLLDEAGYTSVVATNCRQEYARYLVPGDEIRVGSVVSSVSDEKRTALGAGRFVDQVMIYRDQHGAEVARMTWRILKFKPRTAAQAAPVTDEAREAAQGLPAGGSPAARGLRRPRPAQTPDNAFFWEGVADGRLLIQRCTGCKALRHPPGPMCPHCQALDWDAFEACGRGRVYSFVVAHHPPIPPFAYPNCIALVELEEGTRLVSNLVGIDPARVEIGLPVQVEFTRVEPDLVLPLFRPIPGEPR